jgi:hypothetical protein
MSVIYWGVMSSTQRIKPDYFFSVRKAQDILEFDRKELKQELIDTLFKEPLVDVDDMAALDALVRLLRDELTAYGTGGGNQLDDDQFEHVFRTTQRVGKRCGIEVPSLPFRNLTGFYDYWIKHGMKGSWAARREYVSETLRPLEDAIYEAQERIWDETLADPISPRGASGWTMIDAEIAQLRRRFATARTDQDHAAVGNACVRVVEMLAEVAFDSNKYALQGMPVPNKSQTKIRLELILKKELPQSDFEHAFKLSSACIELAQRVKHSPTPSRREAGISADSVILLVNIIRRITQ